MDTTFIGIMILGTIFILVFYLIVKDSFKMNESEKKQKARENEKKHERLHEEKLANIKHQKLKIFQESKKQKFNQRVDYIVAKLLTNIDEEMSTLEDYEKIEYIKLVNTDILIYKKSIFNNRWNMRDDIQNSLMKIIPGFIQENPNIKTEDIKCIIKKEE